ncbi:hypothetical protein SLE2022_213990 [Rubroshorea leprosula]
MQGQRGTIGSLPETLNFDHGSTSSNAAIDQQLCWNNIRNPVENRLPDCMMSPDEANITYVNSYSREPQNLSRWNLSEPSSSGARNEVNPIERKMDNGWSSSMSSCASGGPRLEEPRYDQNSLFVQSSNSSSLPQNFNLNAGLMGHGGDNCQATEHSNLNKSSGSGNERISPATGSESFAFPSGSGGFSVEDNDGRPGSSFDGRRASYKRKALEGTVGQSSMSGSSSHLYCAEGSAWPAVPAYASAGSSLSISTPAEQANPTLGLGLRGSAPDSIPDPTVRSSAESSHRNFRMRINPSSQQESVMPALFPTGNAAMQSVVSSSHHFSRLVSADHSLDLRSTPVVDTGSPPNQNIVIHVPTVQPNVQPFRWNGGSAPRTSSSSNSNVSGDRDAAPREEQRSRSIGRNILDHPMFISPAPELRGLARIPRNQNLSGANVSFPGNVASTSHTVSSSGANQSSVPNPTWVPPPNSSSHYPRRFSELVRRSLRSSLDPESGGQSSNHSSHPSGPPASSEEMVLSAGVVNPGHQRPYPRSASWLERQGDTVLGIPHSLRTLVAASEGRSRLFVSEIRNVLDLMRRGEGLHFEDVMILDPSGLLGVADFHDRHRDMRLDVDNMSYEELLALEERIGNVSTGLSEETILKHLKQQKCFIAPGTELEAEPCCVCQEEYKDGEDLGTLECGHDFHTDCIKQWLMHKNLCPICKTKGLTT